MLAIKIPAGYLCLSEAGKRLAGADLRMTDAARAFLMLVVNAQGTDPNSPPLRYWVGGSCSDVYVNPNDVLRLRRDFEWWSSPLVAPPVRKRGRPKGSELPDGDLVIEGLTMVQDRRANSIHDAAKKLAPRARGNSFDANVRRLGRKMKAATEKLALENNA